MPGPPAAQPGKFAKDRILLEGSPGDPQSVNVSTRAARRQFDIHCLRQQTPGDWRSVKLSNAALTMGLLTIRAPVGFEAIEISGTAHPDFELELSRYSGGTLATRRAPGQHSPDGRALRVAPTDWNQLSRARVEQVVTSW